MKSLYTAKASTTEELREGKLHAGICTRETPGNRCSYRDCDKNMDIERIFFESSLFDIEPEEDEETNPGLYGKQLAYWLKAKFEALGYDVEEIIPEDWGWCVMCKRDPYRLWIGCASVTDEEFYDGSVPDKNNIIWHCFATAETLFFKRLFKKVNTEPGLLKLKSELSQILESEDRVNIVDEP